MSTTPHIENGTSTATNGIASTNGVPTSTTGFQVLPLLHLEHLPFQELTCTVSAHECGGGLGSSCSSRQPSTQLFLSLLSRLPADSRRLLLVSCPFLSSADDDSSSSTNSATSTMHFPPHDQTRFSFSSPYVAGAASTAGWYGGSDPRFSKLFLRDYCQLQVWTSSGGKGAWSRRTGRLLPSLNWKGQFVGRHFPSPPLFLACPDLSTRGNFSAVVYSHFSTRPDI